MVGFTNATSQSRLSLFMHRDEGDGSRDAPPIRQCYTTYSSRIALRSPGDCRQGMSITKQDVLLLVVMIALHAEQARVYDQLISCCPTHRWAA